MVKKITSAKEVKISNKNLRKNNAARKMKVFSIADVSTGKRGK